MQPIALRIVKVDDTRKILQIKYRSDLDWQAVLVVDFNALSEYEKSTIKEETGLPNFCANNIL